MGGKNHEHKTSKYQYIKYSRKTSLIYDFQCKKKIISDNNYACAAMFKTLKWLLILWNKEIPEHKIFKENMFNLFKNKKKNVSNFNIFKAQKIMCTFPCSKLKLFFQIHEMY